MAKFDINKLLPKVTCPACGAEYPFNAALCPDCGEPKPEKQRSDRAKRKLRFPSRAAAGTVSFMEGTAEKAGALLNGRWQIAFAAILSLAVLLAVVVLTASGDAPGVATPAKQGSSSTAPVASSSITISDTYLPTPSPSPVPTPEVVQNPITSMEIVFLNNATGPDITLNKDGQISIQLELRTFPQNNDVKQNWSSSNENILTVDNTGLVQVVGVDPVNGSNAIIKVECGGLEASLIIRVPQYQAQHLKVNKYNAG